MFFRENKHKRRDVYLELYFFRNVNNYKELKEKTCKAYERNSKNIRKAAIVKRIKLEEMEAYYIYNNFKCDNHYIIDNIKIMSVKNGVWRCLEFASQNKSILVMADGVPYAKFVAIRYDIIL